MVRALIQLKKKDLWNVNLYYVLISNQNTSEIMGNLIEFRVNNKWMGGMDISPVWLTWFQLFPPLFWPNLFTPAIKHPISERPLAYFSGKAPALCPLAYIIHKSPGLIVSTWPHHPSWANQINNLRKFSRGRVVSWNRLPSLVWPTAHPRRREWKKTMASLCTVLFW